MKSFNRNTDRFALMTCLGLLSMLKIPAAPTLTDFGFGSWATGPTRRMLVVLADFATAPSFGHNQQFYDGLIFNPQQRPSVNGYFQEVSNGRFTWTKAAIIGPIAFSASELGENFTPAGMDFEQRRLLYHANVVYRVMTSGLFDFSSADINHNGTVTEDELVIVVISNDAWENSSHRDAGRVAPPGSPVAWQGFVVRLWHQPENEFDTMCHEIAHSLGADDLYYGDCLSWRLTVMSCTGGGNLPNFHLDPWHKMKFGWSEPRLVSLRAGGVLNLPAAQLGRTDAPVLLFDSNRGGSEFFLVEYRTRNTSSGSGYDDQVSGNGMVLWHFAAGQPLVARGSPSLDRGGNMPWPSGASTPDLHHAWGSDRLHVQPFNAGADSITVELESIVWVDFNFPCTLCGQGTFYDPYNDLLRGVIAVPARGTIAIKAGSSSETITIRNACTLKAYGGTVVIGR